MIKLIQLKKKMVRDIMIIAGVALIVGAATGWRLSSISGMEEERDRLRQQSQQEISDAQKEQQQYEETIAAFSRYESIPKRHQPVNDYDTVQARIRAVRPVIEALEHDYKFSKLDVKISKIEKPVPVEQSPNYMLIGSELSVDFEGLTDELVYAFIQAIIDRMPGYLSIKDMEVRRKQPITTQLLQQIGASATPVPLVEGKMTLIWKTLKEATPQDGAPPPR